MLKIDVHATRAVLRAQEPLTVGLVGALVHFSFGDPWKNLSRIAVFRQGNVIKDAVVAGDFVAIPWEVLQQPWLPLEIGVYGTDARGKRVIPTVWVRTDPVQPAAEPVDDPGLEPTAAVWQQVLGSMGNLDALVTENRTNLVSAINEANRAVCLVTVTRKEDGTCQADKTLAELEAAWAADKALICLLEEKQIVLPLALKTQEEFHFVSVAQNTEYAVRVDGSGVVYNTIRLATDQDKLPNPNKLTFKGAVEAEYDGSRPLNVTIPGALVVTVTGNGDGTYRADKTYEEIFAAQEAGYIVFCEYGFQRHPLTVASWAQCVFGSIGRSGVYTRIIIGSDNGILVSAEQIAGSSNSTEDSGASNGGPGHCVQLIDQATGIVYELYVSNGTLTMADAESAPLATYTQEYIHSVLEEGY